MSNRPMGGPGSASPHQFNILDRALPKGKSTVSLSAMTFLFREMIRYSQDRSGSVAELEGRLHALGEGVGRRLLEVVVWRDRGGRRETTLLGILALIQNTLWKALLGRPAASLEKGLQATDEYMISDPSPPLTQFISPSKDVGHFTPASFLAGVVAGALQAAGFPGRVTAHLVAVEGQAAPRTTILIKFDAVVMDRDAQASA
ncbi:unnamed protein product [Pedinophyceae sp. YPF-701]|nr:unnamed protein product [Pedinophyceae sp. YPF-701]